MSAPKGKYKERKAKAKDSTSGQSKEKSSLKEKNVRWEKNSVIKAKGERTSRKRI